MENATVETAALITNVNYVKSSNSSTHQEALCLNVSIRSSTVTALVNGHLSANGSNRYDVLLPIEAIAPCCWDCW